MPDDEAPDTSESDEREHEPTPYLGEEYLGSGDIGAGDTASFTGHRTDIADYEALIDAHRDLVDAVAPRGPDTSRERLDANLKDGAWDAEPGSNTAWDGFLSTFALEFEELEHARDQTILSRFVDTAQGGALTKIGERVEVYRKTDEPDSLYRARIKLEFRTANAGGTIADIKEAAGAILDRAPSAILIDEDFRDEPARFSFRFEKEAVSEAGVDIPEFVDLIRRVKAGGVRVFGDYYRGFTHRSETDFFDDVNNPRLAYNGLTADEVPHDPGLGGPYRSLEGPGGEIVFTF